MTAFGLLVPPAAASHFQPAPVDSCAWAQPDCVNPVRAMRTQFADLRDHGDLMGFRPGPGPHPTPRHLYKHWEGVQRLAPGGGRYLAVSQAGLGNAFVIVRLGSRDTSGERLRSNRLGRFSRKVKPPAADKVVAKVPADEGFSHYGGMQALGNVLAIGAEEGGANFVSFWNVAEPSDPRRMSSITTSTFTDGAGTVALAKLEDSSFLMIVGGADSNELAFLRSPPGMSFERAQFTFVARWKRSQLEGGDGKFGDYQNLNLFPGDDGELYLIGTHRLGALVAGPDFADLFRLEGTPRDPVIHKLAKRHLYCGLPGGHTVQGRLADGCNLDAMGGAYVTPSGGLLLYGGEHYTSGPGGTVQMEEFRPAPHRTGCPTMDDAWVELYDDADYDGDRSVMVDYRDRALRDYGNYDKVERFEDKASAAKWCVPLGARFRMFEDKNGCGGTTRDLIGTGMPAADHRFAGTGGAIAQFNDELSCSKWILPPAPEPTPMPTASPTPVPAPSPTPTAAPTPTPTRTPGGLPDLFITKFENGQVTVSNQGTAPAGPFALTVQGLPDYTFTGLGAGASATRSYELGCAYHKATVDSHAQVAESNEANNVVEYTIVC